MASGLYPFTSFFQALLLLVFLVHCGKAPDEGKKAETGKGPNKPPIIKAAEIQPKAPKAEEDLGVAVRSSDPEGNPVELRFQWKINGEEVTDGTDDTLSAEFFQKGDEVECVIFPTDGMMEGKAFTTPPVEIANTLPVIYGMRFKSEVLSPGDEVEIDVKVQDPDDDPISIESEWYVNDQSAQEGGLRFSPANSKKKDRIFVKLSAHDGEGRGPWIKSRILTIQNRPPRIVTTPPSKWGKEEGFHYKVEAVDPDGDPVRVRIKGGLPPGMVWKEDALSLTWYPPEDAKGSFSVTIVAEDNDGGVSTQKITLNPS